MAGSIDINMLVFLSNDVDCYSTGLVRPPCYSSNISELSNDLLDLGACSFNFQVYTPVEQNPDIVIVSACLRYTHI